MTQQVQRNRGDVKKCQLVTQCNLSPCNRQQKKRTRGKKIYSVSPARVSIPAPLDCLGKVIELAVKVKHST